MTRHAEDALARSRISQILNLALAISTPEARGAKRLVTSQDGEIFNLVAASIAAIGTVVAY